MPVFEDTLIRGTTPFVADAQIEYLQYHYSELLNTDFGREIEWGYVLQKLYLYACLKGEESVAEWLQSLFVQLGPIQQIAYRQSFAYGPHLLKMAHARGLSTQK